MIILRIVQQTFQIIILSFPSFSREFNFIHCHENACFWFLTFIGQNIFLDRSISPIWKKCGCPFFGSKYFLLKRPEIFVIRYESYDSYRYDSYHMSHTVWRILCIANASIDPEFLLRSVALTHLSSYWIFQSAFSFCRNHSFRLFPKKLNWRRWIRSHQLESNWKSLLLFRVKLRVSNLLPWIKVDSETQSVLVTNVGDRFIILKSST